MICTEEKLRELLRERKRCRFRRNALRSLGFVVGTLALTMALHMVCRAQCIAAEPMPTFSRTEEQEPRPEDREAPVLTGLEDRIVYQDAQVDFLEGVGIQDNLDPHPYMEVDDSSVDLSKCGVYEVRYAAVDASGNTLKASVHVTVEPWPMTQPPQDGADEAADAVLRELLLPGNSLREQVERVHRWVQNSIHYQNHLDRQSWKQAAETALTTRAGDCYAYFAVSKLLLTRLGVPTIDVEKVKNDPEDSEHFWSLVSVDGGETYYHFDCTPRVGRAQGFCLVTDGELDAYSRANNGSHNRDTSLYPATPEV